MSGVSRLLSPASGAVRTMTALSVITPGQARPIRITALALSCFFCGATVGVKFDIVGDLYLLEPLLALLALQCLLSRGLGKGFVAPMFLGFVAAGFVTSCGYLVADLAAASEPW